MNALGSSVENLFVFYRMQMMPKAANLLLREGMARYFFAFLFFASSAMRSSETMRRRVSLIRLHPAGGGFVCGARPRESRSRSALIVIPRQFPRAALSQRNSLAKLLCE